MLSILVFFNDVGGDGVGGELEFNEFDTEHDAQLVPKVVPKRGTVVVWSNVQGSDFHKKEELTDYEFAPIKNGRMIYTGHLYVHTRETREAMKNGCCLELD